MIYLILIILISIIFAVDFSVHLAFYIPKYFILLINIPLLFVLYYISIIHKNRNFKIRFSIIELLLFLLLIWRFTTNPSLFFIINDYFPWVFLLLIFLTLLVRQISSQNILKFISLFFKVLWIIGLTQSLIGIYQHIQFSDISYHSIKTHMIGTIRPPNGYASLLSIALISLVWDYRHYKKYYIKIILLIIGLLIFSAIFLNGSRGAFLAVLGGMCILIYFKLIKGKFGLSIKKVFEKSLNKFTAIFTITILLFSILIGLYFMDTESSSGRLMIWEISLPMVLENPISGIGFGNYRLEYLNYQAQYFSAPDNQNLIYKAVNLKQAHNEFLELLCETGIIGFLLFVTMWTIILFTLYNKIKNPEHKTDTKYIYIGIMAIFTSVLVHSFVDDPLHFLPTASMIFVLFGVLPAKEYTLTFKKWYSKTLLFITFISLFIFSISIVYKQYIGYKYWQEGKTNIKNLQFENGINSYLNTLEKIPDSGELKFHLGAAYLLSKDYTKAIKYLKESLINYNDRNIYLSLSQAYLKTGKLDKAAESSNIALSMFPDHLAPHLLLGEIFYYKNEYSKSKNSLMKCIKMKTSITSNKTKQIQNDAVHLWQKFYGYNPL